jgi:hypothetical protein
MLVACEHLHDLIVINTKWISSVRFMSVIMLVSTADLCIDMRIDSDRSALAPTARRFVSFVSNGPINVRIVDDICASESMDCRSRKDDNLQIITQMVTAHLLRAHRQLLIYCKFR